MKLAKVVSLLVTWFTYSLIRANIFERNKLAYTVSNHF